MTTVWNGFHSPLALHIEQYLAAKRAMGCKFASEDRMLRLLDRFLDEHGVNGVEAVDAACLEAFMASRHRVNARSYNHLLGVVRRLFDWVVSQQVLKVSPVQAKARSGTARRLPFLFPPEAIKQLLVKARALQDNPRAPLRGATYETIFALLAGLGLRVGEVARLQCGDVDLEREVLEIRDTKFGKYAACGIALNPDSCRCMSRRATCSPITSRAVNGIGRGGRCRPTCSSPAGATVWIAQRFIERSMRCRARSVCAAHPTVTGHVCTICATSLRRTHSCAGTSPIRIPSGACRSCRPTWVTSTFPIRNGI